MERKILIEFIEPYCEEKRKLEKDLYVLRQYGADDNWKYTQANLELRFLEILIADFMKKIVIPFDHDELLKKGGGLDG
jgi:hypothetical protein